MTAEVAVMNRGAVALAADSAVTVTGEHGTKIFASANKIFALSKHRPVGVMIYGSAHLLSVPWETVIKMYREQLADDRFDELPEYAEDFLRWLGECDIFDVADKDRHGFIRLSGPLLHIREAIRSAVRAATASGPVSLTETRRITREQIRAAADDIKARPRRDLPTGFRTRLREYYAPSVEQLIDGIFEKLPLTAAQRKQLTGIAYENLSRQPTYGASGLVIAGFGEKDVLPRLRGYRVDGVLLNLALHEEERASDIDTADMHAYVSGFAQSDVMHLFMEGVDPEYQLYLDNYLDAVIKGYAEVLAAELPSTKQGAEILKTLNAKRDAALGAFPGELQQQRYERSVEPVLDVVASLPFDELAGLAESLVKLTSLKRRVSRDDETVGGPVDVAVISKGDGLVWIERKHYFEPLLNQQFFANYYRH